MFKHIQIIFLLFFIFSTHTLFAQDDTQVIPSNQDESITQTHPYFNFRVGAGSTFKPRTILIIVNAEAQMDPFFALGPMVQAGLSSRTDFLAPTLGGRFIIPQTVFRRLVPNGPGLEFSIQVGFGGAFRDTDGFRFKHFLYEASTNFDIFASQSFSLGVGYVLNYTSSSVFSSFSSLYGGLTYHY